MDSGNITRAMNCSEQLLIDNATISFSSKSNSNFKAMCNVNREADDGGFDCDIANDGNSTTHKFNIQFNYTHRDWWNTVGEAGAAIVAETTRSGNIYTMKYTYYVLDIYEWAFHYDGEPLSRIMHKFHEDGYAQEYLIKTSFSGTITWKKGENAYMPKIREQVKDTMEKWSHNDCWEICNEYERFFTDIDKLPDKF